MGVCACVCTYIRACVCVGGGGGGRGCPLTGHDFLQERRSPRELHYIIASRVTDRSSSHHWSLIHIAATDDLQNSITCH